VWELGAHSTHGCGSIVGGDVVVSASKRMDGIGQEEMLVINAQQTDLAHDASGDSEVAEDV